MLSGCRKHMNVPVVLGSRATDLTNKAAALVHVLRLETGTAESLNALFAAAVSFMTDMGVEVGLANFPKIDLSQLCLAELPGDLQDDVGELAAADSAPRDSEFLFPHTLIVCGVLERDLSGA